jgi:tetratricopeptide (TPR) repeat protein
MSEAVCNSVDKDLRLTQVLDAYLAGLPKGTAPDPNELLAQHPDLADDLRECLDCLAFIHEAARPADADGPQSDAASQEPGSRELGDFRILREIGKGGMGVVYEAEQLSLGRRVALKVLPFAATMDPRQLQRFHNEARAAASLDHPHIVHIHAVGCERAVHFYAMQFIEGQTLAAMIAELRWSGGQPVRSEAQPETTSHVPDAPAPAVPEVDTAPQAAASTERRPLDRAYFRRVAELGIQAAEALDHAHALGIVHRDVKPANLLVDGRGSLWVTDFGLAHIQSDARLTMTGDLVGTLRYMSPEQALAKRVVVDHRTDVYSLGATLYELLTLEPAFTGKDREELLRQIAFEEPKTPRRLNRAIPAELATIVQKAMEKNPAERYATAKELADDLRRSLADEPIRARPPGPARRLRKWGRRHPAWVAAAAAALTAAVVVLSGGIGWLANDRATRAQRTTDEIRTALKESADWQQRRRMPEALAAARRAKGALAGGHASLDLGQQVEARVHDLELLARLEEARLEVSAVNDHDHDLIIRRFGEIFRELQLDVEAGSAEQAGARIRDTSVALELASALDEWAALRRSLHPHDKAGWRHLQNIARAADPDGWRTKVRDALARDDRKALMALASSGAAERLLPWTLSAVGRALRGRDSLKSAEVMLRKAQQLYPDDFWINFILAQIIREAKDALGKAIRADDSISFGRVCVALRPQSAWAHNNLGAFLSDKGDVDGAIAEYREAIRIKPDFPIAYSNLGKGLRDKGLVDEAFAACKTAIRIQPDLAEAQDSLGGVLWSMKSFDEAISAFKKAIRIKPNFAPAHCNLGLALEAKGLVDEAIAACKKAIRLKPNVPEAHNNLGMALCKKKSWDEAIAACKKAIRLKPDYAEAHNNLGRALEAKGMVDEAIAAFQRAIRLKPDDPEARYNLGNTLCKKKSWDEAITAYNTAIHLKPDYAEAYTNLGNTLKHTGKVDEAIAAYQKAIRLKPGYGLAYNNLAISLKAKGLVDEAITAWKKAIHFKPDFAAAHHDLGLALTMKNSWDEAIAAFKKATRLNPDWAEAHCHLGNVLAGKGLLDEAIAAHKAAIRLKPDWAEAHHNLGAALREKGLVDEAIAAFQEAIRLNPDLAHSYWGLGHLLTKKGAFSEALGAYRRGHEVGSKSPGWPYPSGQVVRQAEQLLRADRRLSGVLKGTDQPIDAGECLEFARLCQEYRQRYAAAAHFYKEAFAANPKIPDNLAVGHRYNAACATALAGCGQGKGTGGLDEKKRARLRQQALHWLRADLAAWDRLLEKGTDKARPVIAAKMRHWQDDPDFAGVRGKEALAKLPEAERAPWQNLWADVAATLARAEARAAPPKQGPRKD